MINVPAWIVYAYPFVMGAIIFAIVISMRKTRRLRKELRRAAVLAADLAALKRYEETGEPLTPSEVAALARRVSKNIDVSLDAMTDAERPFVSKLVATVFRYKWRLGVSYAPRAPGSHILRIAGIILSRRTAERIIGQSLADMREEYNDAMARGAWVEAKLVHVLWLVRLTLKVLPLRAAYTAWRLLEAALKISGG